MGVDDYVTKPFSINELLARAKAVLKRIRPIFAEEEIIFENIKINIGTYKVFRNNKEIKLGPNLKLNEKLQVVIPKSIWQSAKSIGKWSLVSCIVSPAFSFDGFEMAKKGWEPKT